MWEVADYIFTTALLKLIFSRWFYRFSNDHPYWQLSINILAVIDSTNPSLFCKHHSQHQYQDLGIQRSQEQWMDSKAWAQPHQWGFAMQGEFIWPIQIVHLLMWKSRSHGRICMIISWPFLYVVIPAASIHGSTPWCQDKRKIVAKPWW